ncbi:hypothetical protein [Streptomyces sp. NPDC002159]
MALDGTEAGGQIELRDGGVEIQPAPLGPPLMKVELVVVEEVGDAASLADEEFVGSGSPTPW